MLVTDCIDFALSHNQEAFDPALHIVDSLEDEGYFAWADVKAFYSPLVSAEKQIARAFARARVICLFVGEKYRDTRWCQEEYALGLRAEHDLTIARVITVHDGDLGKRLIPSSLADRPTFPYTSAGLQGIFNYLSKLPDHSAALAKWAKHDASVRGDLLGHLPAGERTKLVVEHVQFLTKHFAIGQFEQGSEKHALRLGLVGSPPSKVSTHLSPALLIELAWKWAIEILGKYSVHHLLDTTEHTNKQVVSIETVLPFLQLPALFHQYLTVARDRRTPPLNTEAELLSVVDHVLCGFCALCVRIGVPIEEAFRDVYQLLSLFVQGQTGVSRAAAHLRDSLPDIAFPENSVKRRLSIYDLLRS